MSNSRFLLAACFFALCLLISSPISTAGDELRAFVSGDLATFSTAGHPKAKKANFSIRFPSSWKTSEAPRPNTVQTIVSNGGLGLEMITIVTKQIPLESPIPESEINNFFTEENLRDVVPKESKFLRFTKTKIEGTPAAIFECVTDSSRAGIDFYMHQKVLCFFQGNTFIQVACSVGVDKSTEGELLVLKKAAGYSTLFTLIFNSIVFENKYKS